ncbi:hypothetical protein ACIBQ1_09560 [Nonomuraea sp. NPDC050153]|uniref:hypothetical protein n=1 Tax=Nonomuraea sp. NPDC050153 TaxID=3364359 RepID=UPI0037B9B820
MSYAHFSADCDQHHDLVRDFGGDRPPIVVLCGSTRFFQAFRRENLRLTLAGTIVLSIGCDTKADEDIAEIQDMEQVKADLDELHKRKIDLADEVFVLNVGGYVGESTRSEVEYAEKLGKPVRYLEPVEAETAGAR